MKLCTSIILASRGLCSQKLGSSWSCEWYQGCFNSKTITISIRRSRVWELCADLKMKCMDFLTWFAYSAIIVVLMLFFLVWHCSWALLNIAHMPMSIILVHSLPILLITFQEVIKKIFERKTHLLGEDRLFKCQERTSSICTVIKGKNLKIDFCDLHNNWNTVYEGGSINVTKVLSLSGGPGWRTGISKCFNYCLMSIISVS